MISQTAILGAAYDGIVSVLTEETDAEKLEELCARTGARMIIREDFFEDLYSRRPHQPEETHSEADEVLLFPQEDTSLSVPFGEITTAVEMAAEKTREKRNYTCNGDYRLASREEIISIFASLCNGGSLYIL